MKKKIAGLLAIFLAFATMLPQAGILAGPAYVQAAPTGSESGEQPEGSAGGTPAGGESGEQTGAGSEGTAPGGEVAATAAPGQIHVLLGATFPFKKDIAVLLKDQAGRAVQEERKIAFSGTPEDTGVRQARFENLQSGSYTLILSAPGFRDYVQQIDVGGYVHSVTALTGFAAETGELQYKSGSPHPGALLPGDVDNSGVIDDNDRNILTDAIDDAVKAEEAGKKGYCTDINGDGSTDLLDLEYFSIGYQVPEEKDTLSVVEKTVSPASITAGAQEGTNMEGSLEDLLKDGAEIQLSPSDGNPISKENPVALDFAFPQGGTQMDGIVIGTVDKSVTQAILKVTYLDGSGAERTEDIPYAEDVQFLLESQATVSMGADGSLLVNLGGQVAVKKVTLMITGIRNDGGGELNLAKISKVEFFHGLENRIPAPQMDIPQGLAGKVGSKKISLSWEPCVNVTGYEVAVSQGDSQEILRAKGNALVITSFGGKELKNYQEYTVRVQSVNGTWRSGYCGAQTFTPKPDKRPDKPDNVRATGLYKSVAVSWKRMDDTLSYNLFYKKTEEGEYQKIEGITANSYTLTDLEELTEYTVYVTGLNELGESGPSLSAAARTKDADPAVVPKYNRINLSDSGQVSEHIVSATHGSGGIMQNSPQDAGSNGNPKTVWGTLDNVAGSYYSFKSWDDGGYNAMGSGHGLTYEFDQTYKMDTICLLAPEPENASLFYATVRWWDENGQPQEQRRLGVSRRADAQGRKYYQIKLPQPIETKKIQMGLANYQATGTIEIAEVYFYHYDTLMDEIMALYVDDLHMVLKEGVTQETIDGLRGKVNTKDERCGEYHPDREVLERELKTAEDILNNNDLGAPVGIHNTITTNDANRGFGGLNAWQPLGVTAAAGEKVTIYVGHNKKKTNDSTNLQLVAAQYHAESSPMASFVANLKVGGNVIEIPKIWDTAGFESGGALYIQYTGSGGDDRYAVRVSGGVQVPRLDLYQVTEEGERLARVKAYITELDSYVNKMKETHGQAHQGSDNPLVKLAYDEKNCILGASDILLDTMLLSLPAPQILNGSGSGDTEARARRLAASMQSMEDMMNLYYQHKGLNNSAPDRRDQFPSRHLNIRYQRMFSGAFMYASGNHIGIEWNETAGMAGSALPQFDGNGKWISGAYFGWGIGHEVGHCINQGSYAFAEVTNNYFAQLGKAQDTNASVRFKYDNIYQKVTSQASGPASNVFTQLGMYWQLHLAYDRGYNYKTYADYQEQLDSLFFARVDTYARNPGKAPSPGGVALTLSGGRDQILMRLSCAAAKRDLLEFFERWGMTPDQGTKAYAGQFEKEARAIYYVCDNSRVYTMQGGISRLKAGGQTDALGDISAAQTGNRIDFTIGNPAIPENDVLGYELVRCVISGGKTYREPVGFFTSKTFSDQVTTMNNRTVSYEITLVDKYLNRSGVKTAGPFKIAHDGSLDKTNWSISTAGLTAKNLTADGKAGEEEPCAPQPENPAKKAIDQDDKTAYAAMAEENAEIVLEFHRTLVVTGLKCTKGSGAAIKDCSIKVRGADGSWTEVSTGSLGGDKTVYFENKDGKYISTYSATAVKLTVKQKGDISMAELDVLGVTGDNVDFRAAGDGTAAIGKLTADYQYGDKAQDVIPEGSIVFTGSYKGNPAYNVVMLFDQDGNLVGGVKGDQLTAHQIILADVPKEGEIQNVSDGTWIYWIEPEDAGSLAGVKHVRAELYRVNDALTNEGQRLVSDSMFQDMPGTYPGITFSGTKDEQGAIR